MRTDPTIPRHPTMPTLTIIRNSFFREDEPPAGEKPIGHPAAAPLIPALFQ
jgi:hypothetical protein